MNNKTRHRLLWKVLKSNISSSQIAGYALALLAGLTVIMLAAALYADGLQLTGRNGGEKLMPDNFLVLSKKGSASPLSFLGGQTGFDEQEIQAIENQPWVQRCAPFETSLFDAAVTADFGASRFSTALFFEAVPDEFFDSLPADWGFDAENPEVPIILPADYLALYNFGFAPARGLPRLSEQLVTKMPLRILIAGNKGSTTLPGRIVGFSKRLNTIAVPLDFIRWANSRYATSEPTRPLRLIAETEGGSDELAQSYFKANSIDAAGSSEGNDRLTKLLRGFTAIVAAVGLALCLLALFIMILSLRLLVQKNKEAICNLRLLGFSSVAVTGRYRKLVVVTNAIVFVVATVIVAITSSIWQKEIAALGVTPATSLNFIVTGAILAILLTIGAWISLGNSVKRLSRDWE